MASTGEGWSRLVRAGAVVALTLLAAAVAVQAQVPAPADRMARQLRIANKPWTGDFDKLLDRRMMMRRPR